jgi:hypothetical protein
MKKNINAVQKSCGLNTGIIYTVYVMQVKYVPYL